MGLLAPQRRYGLAGGREITGHPAGVRAWCKASWLHRPRWSHEDLYSELFATSQRLQAGEKPARLRCDVSPEWPKAARQAVLSRAAHLNRRTLHLPVADVWHG